MSIRSLLDQSKSFLRSMPTKTTKKPVAKKPAAKKSVRKAVAKKPAAKKPAAKKAAAKKTTTKKVPKKATKKASAKQLVVAPEHESFWVTDGRILNSLIALHDTMNEIENETFGHHVNSEKNDFADWVELTLCDGDCAKDLRKAKTPKSAKSVVVRHLKYYHV